MLNFMELRELLKESLDVEAPQERIDPLEEAERLKEWHQQILDLSSDLEHAYYKLMEFAK